MKLLDKYEKHSEIYKAGFLFDAEAGTFFTEKLEVEPPKGFNKFSSQEKKEFENSVVSKTLDEFKKPEGYEDWTVELIDLKQYGTERLNELGVTDKNNIIQLIGSAQDPKSNERIDERIFSIDKNGGIEILQFGLDRKPHFADKNKEEEKGKGIVKGFRYCWQYRAHPIHEPLTGAKYDFSNAINTPFWSPNLVERFENKEETETLVITEGQFKAFKASIEEIPTVGLTSISHFRDKETNALHPEIIQFVQNCKTSKVVILWDGDCTNISSKDLNEQRDLSKRPGDFYRYAQTIRGELKKYIRAKNFRVYFATINSDKIQGSPKGIDDLFTCGVNADKIREEFSKIGETPTVFLHWEDITTDEGVKSMRRFFSLDHVNKFYQKHAEQIKEKTFVFFGNTYKVEKGAPILEVSKDLKRVMRIQDEYYQIVNMPLVDSNDKVYLEETMVPRKKAEILQDFGKDALKHISTYKGFCNVANHIDYQQVIHGCWNLYQNIEWELKQGEFPTIKFFLHHIFREFYDNEMIFDYFSILFKNPSQKLPVICLVSKLQQTGKSTFINLLKWIFKQNMAIVSNDDLTSEFTSHWVSKLIVASEETLMEKKEGYEKIKNWSTSEKINRNEKNKTAAEIQNMLHFVFASNYEEDFIRIDDYDSRLWIIKVQKIEEYVEDFDLKLKREIPAFLEFISNREIKYKKADRLWFKPEDFMSDAKKTIIQNSEPNVIKELRSCLIEYFQRFETEQCLMTTSNIKQYFQIKGENNYLNKVIKTYLKPEKWKNSEGKEGVTTYSFYIPEHNKPDGAVTISDKGRPFVFTKENFIK